MIGLNIGCGPKKFGPKTEDGEWINLDSDKQWFPEVVRDATRGLPWNDNTFDVVYCENMLEHLNPDDALFVIQEAYRVLNHGGKATLIVPIGVVPDITHKSFYHAHTFANLINQDYRYGVRFQVIESSIKRHPMPFDYEELKVVLQKG